jgi:hypothetical protein
MLVYGFADFCECGDVENFGRKKVLACVSCASAFWDVATVLTVMISVFDGGDGSTSGGRSERSRESGDLLPDDARERCGEGTVACMFAIMDIARRAVLYVCCVSSCGELKSKAVTACVLYQSSPSGGELWFKLPHATRAMLRLTCAKARIPASPHPHPGPMSLRLSCVSGFLGVIALPPSLLLNAQCVKGFRTSADASIIEL